MRLFHQDDRFFLCVVLANILSTTTAVIIDNDAEASQVVAHDFNNDGHIDVAVTVMEEKQVRLYMGSDGGGFGTTPAQIYPTGESQPRGISLGDINGDGVDDVVFCTRFGEGAAVLVLYADPTNNGMDGPYMLRDSGTRGCHSTRVLDVNNDGMMDVIGTECEKIYVLLNPGPSSNSYPWPTENEVELGFGDELDIHQVVPTITNNKLDLLVCQDEGPATWLRVKDIPPDATQGAPNIKKKKIFEKDHFQARAALWYDLNGDNQEDAIICYKRGPIDGCDIYKRIKNSKLSKNPVARLQLSDDFAGLDKPMNVVHRVRDGIYVDLIVAYGGRGEVVLWKQKTVNKFVYEPVVLSSGYQPWVTSDVVDGWVFASSRRRHTTVEAINLQEA